MNHHNIKIKYLQLWNSENSSPLKPDPKPGIHSATPVRVKSSETSGRNLLNFHDRSSEGVSDQ